MDTEIKKEYWSNGKLKYEIPYQNGKLHGVRKGWYENGQLKYEWSYQNGQYHGVYKGWYQNGYMIYKIYYLYNQQVSHEEYKKHELIIQLSGLNNEHRNQKSLL